MLCDRIPAIHGLSQDFIRRAQPTASSLNIHGLWLRSLTHDLLWRVDEPLRGRSEQRTRRHAPTWSWSSVNGKVSYWAECLEDGYFDLLDTPTRIVTAQLSAGSPRQLSPGQPGPHLRRTGKEFTLLTVWSSLTPATLRYTYTASGDVDPVHYDLCYLGRHAYLNTKSYTVVCSSEERTLPLLADYQLCSPRGDRDHHIDEHATLYCLGNFVGESFTASLVLWRKKTASGLVFYQRVGIVAIPHIGRKDGKDSFYAVASADGSVKKKVVCIE